ncbi:class I SAM-dependent methyltransferase [Streptomyces chattanoogensis]|uniref:class I SAM-dependent methyltransferase n=1 Tax=Streptomyces chattanoogensis TaxID=66876 RepID=UPI00368CE6D6
MRQIANAEQEKAWNGYEGTHWARHHDRWDAVNAGFNEPLFTAAAIGARDQVLDVGCGAGHTTRLAARRAAGGRATGIDLSGPMLERARATTAQEKLTNVTFEQGDAQTHPFPPGTFDLAISRFGVMFFADPVAAFAAVRRALRPGGRTAFVCGADPESNEWLQAMTALRAHLPFGDFGAPGGPGMFSLADPQRIRTVLSAAGFTDITVTLVSGYGTWGRDADDAAALMLDSGPGRHLTGQVTPDVRDRARQALTDSLRAHEDGQGRGVRLRGTGWLVTARRAD